jgi:hypothetical protein
MGTIANLVHRWPIRESGSARVQTITGHWMTAEVRGRTGQAEVEHVIVLQDANGDSAVGVPVKAVSGRFLRLVAKDGRPGPEFGPVDVAVLRRLVREAAALPV